MKIMSKIRYRCSENDSGGTLVKKSVSKGWTYDNIQCSLTIANDIEDTLLVDTN